jgi:BirA family transcriptional regulator, biotin operon repressor / biotin---[acetyl-CoA-carboxylase] ligase
MARTLNPVQLLPFLRTLADGGWHSGEALAREAGITRAALSKRVQKLLAWGVEIETQPGRGCRLAQPLELLDADLIRGALAPATRERLQLGVFAATDSTNTQLLNARAADDPQALLAEHQSGGRGRAFAVRRQPVPVAGLDFPAVAAGPDRAAAGDRRRDRAGAGAAAGA